MFYFKKLAAATLVLAATTSSYAADSYLAGNISNITTHTGGMYIMLDSGIPTNCQGTPYNWMLIKEEHKAMISLALTMWVTGKKSVVVYTTAKPGSYCEVNQLDPHD